MIKNIFVWCENEDEIHENVEAQRSNASISLTSTEKTASHTVISNELRLCMIVVSINNYLHRVNNALNGVEPGSFSSYVDLINSHPNSFRRIDANACQNVIRIFYLIIFLINCNVFFCGSVLKIKNKQTNCCCLLKSL